MQSQPSKYHHYRNIHQDRDYLTSLHLHLLSAEHEHEHQDQDQDEAYLTGLALSVLHLLLLLRVADCWNVSGS